MSELINITYIEGNAKEQELVETVQDRIKTLGGISVKHVVYFDEYGADGLTPTIEFTDGTVINGSSSIKRVLDENTLAEYL